MNTLLDWSRLRRQLPGAGHLSMPSKLPELLRAVAPAKSDTEYEAEAKRWVYRFACLLPPIG